MNEKGENSVGKGKVFAGKTISEVLGMLNIVPDFTYTKPQGNTILLFVHRQSDGADFYWVNTAIRGLKIWKLPSGSRVVRLKSGTLRPERLRRLPIQLKMD
jgi:hypothetical protein